MPRGVATAPPRPRSHALLPQHLPQRLLSHNLVPLRVCLHRPSTPLSPEQRQLACPLSSPHPSRSDVLPAGLGDSFHRTPLSQAPLNPRPLSPPSLTWHSPHLMSLCLWCHLEIHPHYFQPPASQGRRCVGLVLCPCCLDTDDKGGRAPPTEDHVYSHDQDRRPKHHHDHNHHRDTHSCLVPDSENHSNLVLQCLGLALSTTSFW
mmetsp:Transcript_28765/g.62124  ORF Transcript_28765/g.62124 Transcript_28765/m.62124 type:complete len:205 (+) Transcript_28765:578-1192(+)